MNLNYKELSDKAFSLHSSGNLNEAKEIYTSLLQQNPSDVNVLNLLGLLLISQKELTEAIYTLNKAYSLNKSVYVVTNLAKAYYYNNEFNKAINFFKEALQIKESDDIYYSMALTYKKLNDYENVIYCYKKSLQLNPVNYNSMYNLASVYKDTHDFSDALIYAKSALELNNKDENLYAMLSGLYERNNDYKSSIEMLEKAIEINKDNYLYHYNLGVLYSKTNNNDRAAQHYIKAININPEYLQSYLNIAALYKGTDNELALEYLLIGYKVNNKDETLLLSLAQVYKDLYKYEESRMILSQVLNINPKCAEAYSLLGIISIDNGDCQKALEYYEKAISIDNKNLNYLHGKAIVLKYMGKSDECKTILECILEKNPDMVKTSIALGMMYLTEGNFAQGMKLYRVRSKESKFNDVFKNKIWNENVDITNKSLLLYSDCGLGDTIMYSRYLPFLKKISKRICLQTDKPLIKILQNSFQDITIIKKGTMPPEYDYVLSLMDIQYLLNMDFNNIPFSEGYLTCNDDINIPKFNTDNKKIGLFWQGNKKIFKNRSIKFDYIKSLTEKRCDIDFYSFQIETEIDETYNFYNLDKYIKDYNDTAKLLKKMDLLITIDSSIVHMAGALGIKTYLLLPYIAEWRWFNNTSNTPWYNSVRIIRQNKTSDWSEIFEKLIIEL
ncbi:tetratricopeptide repeat protein [bacterium]|nr:tetratricopeptide repeat protein [bacterium]